MKPAWLFLGTLLILASQLTQAQDPGWPANIKRLWEATERHARITMQEELVTESEIVVAGFDRTLDRGVAARLKKQAKPTRSRSP